jgi:hypothetical protein
MQLFDSIPEFKKIPRTEIANYFQVHSMCRMRISFSFRVCMTLERGRAARGEAG